MNAEQLFWLYQNLAGYWAVGAWCDTYGDPTDEDFRSMSIALLWIESAREGYDEIHGEGATKARYEELQELYRARYRERELALNEKGNK